MKKVAFLMIGVSGSGKSTVTNKIADHIYHRYINSAILDLELIKFSLDDCRYTFRFGFTDDLDPPFNKNEKAKYSEAFMYSCEKESEFKEHVDMRWKKSLNDADILFIDNTNLSRKSRARWTTEAQNAGFTVVAVQVVAPLSVVIERQTTRPDKSVPLYTVKEMYLRQQEVQLGSECNILINVDGTGDGTILEGNLIALFNQLGFNTD